MTTPFRPDMQPDAPFLDTSPPHWAARGTSTVIIALFTVAVLISIFVTIPETVSGPFVLVPKRGADIIRAPHGGTVAEVRAREGETVENGSTLFVILPQQAGQAANHTAVRAPCAGSVARTNVSTAGAIVQAGDALGRIACAGTGLQVEMSLGQSDMSRVRPGQDAKLLYEAFPYQRFGVRFGRVAWVGPGSPTRGQRDGADSTFRALIVAGDSAIAVGGEALPLLAGMRGEARIVTGRRSLISFALGPIQALEENFASPPPPPSHSPASASR
jgi:multidrug efflux pump subunit AcrA (membrane-fusion protein)